MTQNLVTVDVREDIRAGREPFSRIMNAVAVLQPDQTLLLIAPFEPVPLYGVLRRQGFTHQTRSTEKGECEVLFSRIAADQPTPTGSETVRGSSPAPGNSLQLDARGLEPPQPMITILEALATLPQDTQLLARTDRRPMHLYTRLEERGFIGETVAEADGTFLTRIWRH